MNKIDRWNDAIRSGEGGMVNLLSAIAPWGAPLAPAYMAYAGMQVHLGYPWEVALVIAGVIEILGLATVHTTLLFWRHNRRYSKDTNRMPTGLAGSMFALYLAVVLIVNVVMEWPEPWVYTPILARALLSLLAVPAAVTLAIRSQHTELLREIRDEREERRRNGARTRVERDANGQNGEGTGIEREEPVTARYVCGECGYQTDDQRAWAGHGRKHSVKVNGANGAGIVPVAGTNGRGHP